MYLLTLLQQLLSVVYVQSILIGRTMRGRSLIRNLGRWSFDEPCIAGPIFYENPREGISNFDLELKQYTRTEGRIYEDKDLSIETTVHSDTICDFIETNHVICDYFLVDDTVGVFSLFSGLAELEFSNNQSDTELRPTGKGRFVFQGGSDLHGGIIGKVNTVYGEDLITHDFCVQGSTYDHLIPPLPSDSVASNISDSNSTGGQSIETYDRSSNVQAAANTTTTASNAFSKMVGISCMTVVAMTSLLDGLLLS